MWVYLYLPNLMPSLGAETCVPSFPLFAPRLSRASPLSVTTCGWPLPLPACSGLPASSALPSSWIIPEKVGPIHCLEHLKEFLAGKWKQREETGEQGRRGKEEEWKGREMREVRRKRNAEWKTDGKGGEKKEKCKQGKEEVRRGKIRRVENR